MKSTLFASTLAATLTATSFGQVDVELISSCCGNSWIYTYQNEVLTFVTSDPFGYTRWNIQVPDDTLVQFTCSILDPNFPFIDVVSDSPLTAIYDTWNAQGQPSFWTGAVFLPAGNYFADFFELQGTINFNYELEAQGSCCVTSGCTSNSESNCTELGGTWTEGGSCDECEPVADDCPADVDGDGIPDACDADSNIESPYGGATYWDPAEGGNGHWYAILEKPESASEMLQIAEDLGAHVATIGSEVEDSFLRSITQPFFQEAVILGGQQIGSTQTFAWVDGTPFDYAAWAPGEPNGVNPGEWIAYYESSSNSYQGWHDVTFSDTSVTRFALEWSIDDCNSNGIIDSCEIVPDDCGNEAEPCPADVDGDGSIGFSDVLIILNDWGACP